VGLFSKRVVPPGAAPGTLVINKQSPRPHIRVMDYNAGHYAETVIEKPEDVIPYLTDGIDSISWIDVHGLGDEMILRNLGGIFDLHPLALEDVVHVGQQRPKTDEYDNHQFVIARMVEIGPSGELETEQLSIFLGTTFLLTFQEFPGDPYDPIRERLRKGRGMLRKMGPDYLMYSLLDATIDHYFPVMEHFSVQLESLEDAVILDPKPDTLRRIHRVKSELLAIRRCIWPQRDLINALIRDESSLIKPETRIHLRDCYDHAVQVMDMVETYRELASGLLDVYMSTMANKTNAVMKVLTIVSTIFIPLTFIAGVYGMNFELNASPWNMPELTWYYGYPLVMAVMFVIALGMLAAFRWAGWIGRGEEDEEGTEIPAPGLPSQQQPEQLAPAEVTVPADPPMPRTTAGGAPDRAATGASPDAAGAAPLAVDAPPGSPEPAAGSRGAGP
jgi:magnesium transporter